MVFFAAVLPQFAVAAGSARAWPARSPYRVELVGGTGGLHDLSWRRPGLTGREHRPTSLKGTPIGREDADSAPVLLAWSWVVGQGLVAGQGRDPARRLGLPPQLVPTSLFGI